MISGRSGLQFVQIRLQCALHLGGEAFAEGFEFALVALGDVDLVEDLEIAVGAEGFGCELDAFLGAAARAAIGAGEDFGGAVPNFYKLVREAIDRGVPLDEVKPGNKITRELKKLIAPTPVKPQVSAGKAAPRRLTLSWARQ